MKSRRPWLMLALLLCAATVVAAALPSTLAYIAANSNTVRNTFRVEYLPPEDIAVPVRVHKTVLSLGDETLSPAGFSFRLQNMESGETISMTSFIDGSASVMLPFTADDAGKTYTYRLYEINGGREHVSYDETVYDITITLSVNEVHEMIADLTVNGSPVTEIAVEFVNLYTPAEIPDTGDEGQLLLWSAMLAFSGAGLVLLMRRRAA